jgi:hypothetical protein
LNKGPIGNQLSELPQLSRSELSELWRRLFETDPPREVQKDLILQFVAYRLQERECGALSERSRRRLCELKDAIQAESNKAFSFGCSIKPGTRLIRQWRGQVHVVNIEDESYEYKGIRYKSLSEIARLITGTRWSGPLFFGLKNKPAERRAAK